MQRDKLIRRYFNMGLNYKEIICLLFLHHNIILSERQLKRILNRLGLYRRKQYSDLQEVENFIEEQVSGSGKLHGYRWMHLKCLQNGLTVSQKTVRLLLNRIDPVGVSLRKRKRLRRRQYFNKGPNYLWHVDSYDKLKYYGIGINGCIDGFSRYVIWLKASYTNNNPRVIASYYMSTIETLRGCPRTIRSDMGTENRYIEQMQIFLRNNLQERNILPPYIYGTSTHNQRIEAWWGILRKHNSQFWINLFENLKNDNLFNGTYIDKALIQFCFLDIIQEELDQVVYEWNIHKIASTRNARAPVGRPIIMYTMPEVYNKLDYVINVSPAEISACKEECVVLNSSCSDEDVSELCDILMAENQYTKPNTAYEAVDLYVNLRTLILEIL